MVLLRPPILWNFFNLDQDLILSQLFFRTGRYPPFLSFLTVLFDQWVWWAAFGGGDKATQQRKQLLNLEVCFMVMNCALLRIGGVSKGFLFPAVFGMFMWSWLLVCTVYRAFGSTCFAKHPLLQQSGNWYSSYRTGPSLNLVAMENLHFQNE